MGVFWIFYFYTSVCCLLVRILFLAERQRSNFSRIYGYSVASILFAHFVINIGMTIGLLPVIGIPLPFISYGGSSLLAFTILLFIFLNLDSYRLTNIKINLIDLVLLSVIVDLSFMALNDSTAEIFFKAFTNCRFFQHFDFVFEYYLPK